MSTVKEVDQDEELYHAICLDSNQAVRRLLLARPDLCWRRISFSSLYVSSRVATMLKCSRRYNDTPYYAGGQVPARPTEYALCIAACLHAEDATTALFEAMRRTNSPERLAAIKDIASNLFAVYTGSVYESTMWISVPGSPSGSFLTQVAADFLGLAFARDPLYGRELAAAIVCHCVTDGHWALLDYCLDPKRTYLPADAETVVKVAKPHRVYECTVRVARAARGTRAWWGLLLHVCRENARQVRWADFAHAEPGAKDADDPEGRVSTRCAELLLDRLSSSEMSALLDLCRPRIGHVMALLGPKKPTQERPELDRCWSRLLATCDGGTSEDDCRLMVRLACEDRRVALGEVGLTAMRFLHTEIGMWDKAEVDRELCRRWSGHPGRIWLQPLENVGWLMRRQLGTIETAVVPCVQVLLRHDAAALIRLLAETGRPLDAWTSGKVSWLGYAIEHERRLVDDLLQHGARVVSCLKQDNKKYLDNLVQQRKALRATVRPDWLYADLWQLVLAYSGTVFEPSYQPNFEGPRSNWQAAYAIAS